jgi:scyllo-inositol 2-dehydrogenase (NADP+)
MDSVRPASSHASLRTALVGLGRIGYGFHGPEIRKNPGYTLVGVVDPLEERRREAAAAWSVPCYASMDELWPTERPDVVVIASPTQLHAEQTRMAFAHGAHVLCDKPVATSVAELHSMLDAARAAGRRFLAYQPARMSREVQALRELLFRDLLGPIHYIRRSMCTYVRRHDWQAQRAHGGGMLNNWSPHGLDELISLFPGETFRDVFCQTRAVVSAGDAEDVVKATLVTETGIILDLDVSQACALAGPSWEVRGKYGSAILDQGAPMWAVRYFDPAEAPPPPTAETGLAAASRSYGAETLPWRTLHLSIEIYPQFDYYNAARNYFLNGRDAPVTPEESLLVLELIDRCRVSAEAASRRGVLKTGADRVGLPRLDANTHEIDLPRSPR